MNIYIYGGFRMGECRFGSDRLGQASYGKN